MNRSRARWPRSCLADAMRLVAVAVLPFLLLLFALSATAATAQVATPQFLTPQPATPQEVVDAFEIARGAGDLDASLDQLADTAVITVQGEHSLRSFTGPTQLRSYMQTIGLHFQTVMRSRPEVRGSSITWTERDEYPGEIVDSTVVAIVSAGRIVSLSYRATETVATASASPASAGPQLHELPSLTWPATLAGLGLLLLGVVFGVPRRKASRSRLNGRLLVALRTDYDRDSQDHELKRFEHKRAA